MRIAVLVTGQPRFLEEGAWWFKNRTFPDHFKNLKVDYYCYFWNDGSPNLESRIVSSYNPIKYKIDDYNGIIDQFTSTIVGYNLSNPHYSELVQQHIHENILYSNNSPTLWGRNFWGQYFATAGITDLVGDLSEKYDIVIKTRTDAVFTPLSEQLWCNSFKNIQTNPAFNDKMFAPWMHIQHGIPHMGDFAFISKPDLFYQFSKNIYKNCIDIATKDKALFYELTITDHQYITHWIWNKISNYSKSNWLSFSIVWPTPFKITLLRQYYNMQSIEYTDIPQI
jgi:hypothetical protein